MSKKIKLAEGLRSGDLKNMISHRFTIDRYKSKIGEDEDILVLAFQINDRFATVDAMEFIEKSYNFVLDADMSTGEESNGNYYLFVEIERKPKAIDQILELLNGLERLCGIDCWKFKYYKDVSSHEFNRNNAAEHIPLDKKQYREHFTNIKKQFVKEMINQGTAVVTSYSSDDKIIVEKPYAQSIEFKVEDIGLYESISKKLKGAIQLDEKSNSEILFLEKFLGNRDIHKIDNKFIIQKDNQVLVLSMIK